MAFIVKALAAGTWNVTGSYFPYTVPNGKSAMVTSVRLANGSATIAPSVNVYVKPSGGAIARRIAKKDHVLALGASLVLEDVLTLGQGDAVQVDLALTGPPTVGYLLNGLERE